jgi:hypothetical protein
VHSINSARCLTRVMVDDDGLIVAELQLVMQRIQASLRSIPTEQREYVANALLNLAVSRMVREEGTERASSMLMRLSDVVSGTEAAPPAIRAIDLTRQNS